jgi:hemoglobin
MSNITNNNSFGFGDHSFKAAGGKSGLTQLALDFYQSMDTLPEAKHIRSMHRDDLDYMRDKLALFLSAWLGGPSDWFSVFNYPSIPAIHQLFVINENEKNAWLLCMDQAIEMQNWDPNFKVYLASQFRRPANVVQMTSKS